MIKRPLPYTVRLNTTFAPPLSLPFSLIGASQTEYRRDAVAVILPVKYMEYGDINHAPNPADIALVKLNESVDMKWTKPFGLPEHGELQMSESRFDFSLFFHSGLVNGPVMGNR